MRSTSERRATESEWSCAGSPPSSSVISIFCAWSGLGLGLGLGLGSNPNPNPNPNQVSAQIVSSLNVRVSVARMGERPSSQQTW